MTEMDSLAAPEGFRALKGAAPFVEHVGPLYFKKVMDGVRFGFRAAPHHANSNGVIHGGMLMFFADEIFGNTVWFAAGRAPCATVSFNCDFVRAARPGDWIECEVAITRKGRNLAFVRGRLVSDGETLVTADGVWKLFGKN